MFNKYLVEERVTHKENILCVMGTSTQVTRSLGMSVFLFLLAPVIIHGFWSTVEKQSNVLLHIDESNIGSAVMNKCDILIFPIQLNYKL